MVLLIRQFLIEFSVEKRQRIRIEDWLKLNYIFNIYAVKNQKVICKKKILSSAIMCSTEFNITILCKNYFYAISYCLKSFLRTFFRLNWHRPNRFQLFEMLDKNEMIMYIRINISRSQSHRLLFSDSTYLVTKIYPAQKYRFHISKTSH